MAMEARGGGGLEEAMRGLQLSSAKRKSIKLGKQIAAGSKGDDWHVVGKVLAEKPIAVDGIQQTLGRIWCADRGMSCKDMGDNMFLFHFNHPSGRRRALEDGPWMAGHHLLVMVLYDGSCSLDAIEFTQIPIWIRVLQLPMGMMNKEIAEIIGNEVGDYLDVDVEENGTTIGRYLRIKVRIDIRRALLQGVTVVIEGEGDEGRWCPLEYEFLPEFFYSCGIIGHTEKNCVLEKEPNKSNQYGKWLRVLPARRRFSDEIQGRNSLNIGSCDSHVSRSSGDWRKDKEERSLAQKVSETKENEKKVNMEGRADSKMARLRSALEKKSSIEEGASGEKRETVEKLAAENVGASDGPHVHGTVQTMQGTLQSVHGAVQKAGKVAENEESGDGKRKRCTYKKMVRTSVGGREGLEPVIGTKRGGEVEDWEDVTLAVVKKKMVHDSQRVFVMSGDEFMMEREYGGGEDKEAEETLKTGLPGQLRKTQ